MTTTTPASRDSDRRLTADQLDERVSQLVADARHLRKATSAFGDSAHEAEQRYADEVTTTLATLELDLKMARASLDAQGADSSEELRRSMDDVEDAARTWLDELTLQARLGEMEVRDRAGVLGRRIEQARSEARRAASRIAEVVDSDLDETRRVAVHGIREVRDVLGDAASALRALQD
jgi:F0F1-type ATP synthase membrane subunit b/b'